MNKGAYRRDTKEALILHNQFQDSAYVRSGRRTIATLASKLLPPEHICHHLPEVYSSVQVYLKQEQADRLCGNA